jgi:hypothetical protein
MPDFARVCEHCGHQAAEQLLLPSDALSLQSEDRQEVTGGFDFAPEESSAMADSFEHPVSGFEMKAPLEVRDETPESAFPSAPETHAPAGVLFASANPEETTAAAAPSRRREIVLVTMAAGLSGIVTLALLLMRTSPGNGVVTASTPAPATVDRAAPVSGLPVTRWTAANSEMWAGPQKNNIAFEVEAENTVGVWMRTVRPALVVRCTSGSIEAFVFTSSAAQIEPKTDDHTVQFSFDDGTTQTELWRDSEEHDALFAPDGAAFASRLMQAKAMTFGFTPHNAAAVKAQFTVAGLGDMLNGARRQCGKF